MNLLQSDIFRPSMLLDATHLKYNIANKSTKPFSEPLHHASHRNLASAN